MKYFSKRVVIIAVAVVVLTALVFVSRASVKRSIKSLKSEYSNGIKRTITVYDYSGNVIKTYSGKFDVTESDTGIMFDDEKGKRTIITGGIVINEED